MSETFTIKLQGSRVYTFMYPTDFLGEGSMASLYKGISNDGQSVAIKALKPENEKSPVTLNLWKNNAEFKLKHKNLMQVYEEIYQNERRHIVLEYIDGKNYEELFDSLSLDQHLFVIRQILEGLEGLHENSYIHRDIKPSNILIDVKDNYFTKIIDYDLVMHKDTRISHFVGTEKYAPLESLTGEHTDHRSDLWAVGVMLYRVYNQGKLPFNGKNKTEIINSIKANSTDSGNYPPKVAKIIEKSLHTNPEQRYSSAKEMLDDVNNLSKKPSPVIEFLNGEGVFKLPLQIAISAVFIILLSTLIVLMNN